MTARAHVEHSISKASNLATPSPHGATWRGHEQLAAVVVGAIGGESPSAPLDLLRLDTLASRQHRSKSLPALPPYIAESHAEDYDLPFLQELRGTNKKHRAGTQWLTSKQFSSFVPGLFLVLLLLLVQLLLPHLETLLFPAPPLPPPSCPSPTINPFLQDLYCRKPPEHTARSWFSRSPSQHGSRVGRPAGRRRVRVLQGRCEPRRESLH